MLLSEFMEASVASNNHDGSWSVHITLVNGQPSTLTVDKCDTEYDAKERAYLYLLDLIETK